MSQINELKKQVTDLICEELSKESRTYAGAYAGKIADKVLDVFFGWLGSLQEDVSVKNKNRLQKPPTKDPIKVRHIIIMLLDAHGGEMVGGDSIHAEVYFLYSMFSNLFCELNLVFRHHFYYGYPYSPKIMHAVDELMGEGFAAKRHHYAMPILVLLEFGRYLVEELRAEYTEEYDAIQQFVERLGKGEITAALIAAAKVHFLVKGEGEVLTAERAIREMRQSSLPISATSVNIAVRILDRLGLLEK